MSTFGAFEDDAMTFLDKVAGFYAAKQQESTSECKDKLIQQLQIAVLTDVARRLTAASGAIESEEGVTASGKCSLFSEGGVPLR